MKAIGLAVNITDHEVNKAGLVVILGGAANTYIKGEDQQKLDV